MKNRILLHTVAKSIRARLVCLLCAALAAWLPALSSLCKDGSPPAKCQLGDLLRIIADSEYNIEWKPEASCYQSPNRQQNLRFTYQANGFTVQPGFYSTSNENWRVTFELKGFAKRSPVRSPNSEIDVQNRLATVRTDEIIYCYTNSPEGMRQTFVIPHKPESGKMSLDLALQLTGVRMQVDQSENCAYFVSKSTSSEVMRYRDLKVWDSRGKPLPAAIRQTAEDRLVIDIDDGGAEYPIVVDPVVDRITFRAPLGDAGSPVRPTQIQFGFSVAYTGVNLYTNANTNIQGGVVIGAPNWSEDYQEQGKVFIFRGTPTLGYDPKPDWSAKGDQAYCHFGYSVAVAFRKLTDNSTENFQNFIGTPDLIVGAPDYSTNGLTGNGAVFVYYLNAGTGGSLVWPHGTPENATFSAFGEQSSSRFGFSVASAGMLNPGGVLGYASGCQSLIVGAPNYNSGYGRVYVFFPQLTGNHLGGYYAQNVTPDVTLDCPDGCAHFGWSLSTIGDPTAQGSGFGGFFTSSGYDGFIVGAPFSAGGPDSQPGAAFVYTADSGLYNNNPDLTLHGSQNETGFGISVGAGVNIYGNITWDIMVGSTNYADANGVHGGGVYIYEGPFASGSSTVLTIPTAQNQAGAALGASLAALLFDDDDNLDEWDLDSDEQTYVFAGAPHYSPGVPEAGAAFIFAGTTGTPVRADGKHAGAHFGTSVAAIRVIASFRVGIGIRSDGSNGGRGFIVGAPQDYSDDSEPDATSYGSAFVLNWNE